MRRNEHLGARVLAVTGLVGGTAYLGWRAMGSMDGSPPWLAVPFYLVELIGFLSTLLLTWALWPMPRRDRAASEPPSLTDVDVVIRIVSQSVHELRATLLALRHVTGAGCPIVVDHSGRPEVASLAIEHQAVYAATDPDDHNGLQVILAAVRSPNFLLLDAGDVPTPDIVDRLAVDLADRRVAIVQGLGESLVDDGPEYGPDGRHELLFERASLNPALGRRGLAVWSGSGSLVRVEPLRELTTTCAGPVEAWWGTSTVLHAAGWRITAPADVAVFAHRAVRESRGVYVERVQRVRAARHMVTGRDGVLRSLSFTPTQRLATLAWSVRPLSSFRRVVFIAVLCGALLSGQVPFTASITAMAVLWMPYFVYSSLAVSLLSGWTLRPGDRARWSLHNIGASLSSHGDPMVEPERDPIVTLPSSQYGASLVMAVVILSIVLALRGLSDRFTHSMGSLPQPALLAMVAVSLWLLGLSLDLLRVLGRRGQQRRATRVLAARSAGLGDRAVTLLDLTALGAGVASHAGFEIGERAMLETAVPTATGVTTVCVPAVVRNVSRLPTGEYRLGLEFDSIDDATANALAEYCLIEPVWQQLGVMEGHSVTESRPIIVDEPPELTPGAGRMALRVVSLLALVGAVASSLPARAEASAQARWSGRVVAEATGDGIESATVTVVCRGDADGARTTTVTDAGGRFSLEVPAEGCQGFVTPPDGYGVVDGSTASRVALVRDGSSPSPGVLVAEALAIESTTDQHLRSALSAVVMALIAVICGSLLAGLSRPRRHAFG